MNKNTSIKFSFKELFEKVRTGLMILTEDGDIHFINDAIVKHTNLKKTELTGKKISHIINKDKTEFQTILKKVYDDEIERNIETEIITKNISFAVTIHLSVIKDSNSDNYKYILAQFNNIFQLNEFSEKAYTERNLLIQLINNIPDYIYIKDAKSRFIISNNYQLKIFHAKTMNEIVGKTDYDFYKKKYADIFYKDEQKIIKTGIPIINKEEKGIDEKGNLQIISTTKVPLKDKNGEIIGIMGIGRDITKSIEEKEELRKLKIAAEKADQLKSAFLANMSHEIRTPLNGILGFSQFLRQENLPEKKKEKYLDIILINGKQLLNLINDIIDISKIDSSQLKIAKKEFYLNMLMNQLLHTFKGELKLKRKSHIEIKAFLELDDNKSQIRTDDFRLRQILGNLLANAVKFTEDGEINFGYKVIDDHHMEFFVEDTGIGIPEELQSVIFERFRQADNSSTRRYGGTGLGLSICNGLVKLLGGKIRFKSEPNKGSLFLFTIPVK